MTKTKSFLDLLESNISKLKEEYEENLVDSPEKKEEEGKKKVTFGENMTCSFDKRLPANKINSRQSSEEGSFSQENSSEDNSEDEDEEDYSSNSEDDVSGSGSDEYTSESEEDDDLDDFDKLSPMEQLKLLMDPVEDEEDEDEDEDEDEESSENEYDFNDEGDYDDESMDIEEEEDEQEEHVPKKSSKKLNLSLNDEDSEDENDLPQSAFQRQQDKMRKMIAALEEENLAEKSWTLRGEVTAADRPVNSLLAEHLDFEHASKAAPIITPEVTNSIEELIKQRIIDRAWDDVERKLPHEVAKVERKKPELDMERTKSLSQVYEEQAVSSGVPRGPIDEETKKVHDEIGQLFSKICHSIDSLSNFKFNPRAYPLTEVQLKSTKNLKPGEKHNTSSLAS